MIDKKAFKKTFGAPLEDAGYFKRGQSWYLNGEDTIIVVNLQKSDWGERYYINIGLWLKKLGEPIYPIGQSIETIEREIKGFKRKKYGDTFFPDENECHIGIRAESLFLDERLMLYNSCSLESSDEHQLSILANFIKNEMIPLFQNCTHEDKLIALFDQGVFERSFIWWKAREYLSREKPD